MHCIASCQVHHTKCITPNASYQVQQTKCSRKKWFTLNRIRKMKFFLIPRTLPLKNASFQWEQSKIISLSRLLHEMESDRNMNGEKSRKYFLISISQFLLKVDYKFLFIHELKKIIIKIFWCTKCYKAISCWKQKSLLNFTVKDCGMECSLQFVRNGMEWNVVCTGYTRWNQKAQLSSCDCIYNDS